jgi:hypothetical protein
MPVSLQLMIALRFYATGSFLAVTADVHRISRPSVSKAIKDASNRLIRMAPEYIKMPTSQFELLEIMQGFHNIANFPNVRLHSCKN